MSAHVFRLFHNGPLREGDVVDASAPDRAHLKSIRASPGLQVELVDTTGALFSAELESVERLRVLGLLDPPPHSRRHITLFAGAGGSSAWDALVDQAVQAGVDAIVPVTSSSSAPRIDSRAARTHRVARESAKQAKRRWVPSLASAIAWEDVPAPPDGTAAFVLHAQAPPLTHGTIPATDVWIAVGAADGIPREHVRRLQHLGWVPASLGPTVLRSELAAAVAVAVMAMGGGAADPP